MKRVFYLASAIVMALTMVGMGPIAYAKTPKVITGIASWYGPGFHGRRTASGETYNMDALTAAHKSLPFGTRVEVTNERNGKTIVVRINDRGPYAHGRVLDLSRGAARALGVIGPGTAPVAIRIMGADEQPTRVAQNDAEENDNSRDSVTDERAASIRGGAMIGL